MLDQFKPLEDYGIIGNLETCALVGRDGSIDWCCLPFVYSPSVFGSILDADGGGRFALRPAGEYESSQQYMERTNVLQTTFETDDGTLTVTDFMPIVEDGGTEQPRIRALYRKVACTEGSVDVSVEFSPRFDYDRAATAIDRVTGGVAATGESRRLFLSSPVELTVDGADAGATVTMEEYDAHWFVLQYSMKTPTAPDECERLLDDTAAFWRDWAHACEGDDCLFVGTGHDLVVRSALVLKLLTYRETGAIVAAPTTSLPEVVGGGRNWDYRYSWIRDGAITVRALTNLRKYDEAEDFVHRFIERSREGETAEVQPLYGVEGDTELEEEELPNLSGYRHSSPVRVGNEAAEQQQLDVYGDLVLAIYQRLWSTETVAEEDWITIREIAEYVCDHWTEPGAGIWEHRGEPRQLTHSKVMCWAALDRSIELAERASLDAPLDRWSAVRAEIKEEVLERGFDEERNSFTQSYENEKLDATGLLIVLSGFLPFDDPRLEGTVEAIKDELVTENCLVYRNEDEELPGEEGAFVFCSFWLVDALVALGRVDEAWEVFESVLEYASPLGLFAEEINPETGRQLGNFPQAFSHIGLINSALYLREAEYDWATVEPLGMPTLVQERQLLERGDD